MDIIKDLLLASLFLIMITKYFFIYRSYTKQKRFLIDTLSHDLRVATIAQIRGLEILEKENLCQNTSNSLIKEIRSSARFSLDMINMLLNSYRYENGEQVLNYENFSLAEIVFLANNYFSDWIAEKNVQIHNNIENQFLIADKTEIKKLMTILLSIAIENADHNSSIGILTQEQAQLTEVQ